MTGYEIEKALRSSQGKGRCFIKWWRKENDFADYELVDNFLEHLIPEHEFGGFELLDTEQMWRELKRREPKRVMLSKRRGEPVIHWQHQAADGGLREDVYRYSPEVIMAIFDRETHGDTLC